MSSSYRRFSCPCQAFLPCLHVVGRHFEDDPNMSFAMLEEDAVTKRPVRPPSLHTRFHLHFMCCIMLGLAQLLRCGTVVEAEQMH